MSKKKGITNFNNRSEHRTISYAIEAQNIIFSVIGISLLGFLFLIFFTNPYENVWAFWAFWINLFIFLSGVICYIQFWYYFSLKSSLIYVSKVNKMLFSSCAFSSLIVLALTLNHIQQINGITTLILASLFLLVYLIYK